MSRHRKCVVADCECKSNSCKLFSFPRKSSLRCIWVQQALPHCPILLDSIRHTRNRLICRHHFEDKYLKGGNRKQFAVPTLFTSIEIAKKEPVSTSITFNQNKQEHKYHRGLPFNYGGTVNKVFSAAETKIIKHLLGVNHDHSSYCKTVSEYVPYRSNHEVIIQTLPENSEVYKLSPAETTDLTEQKDTSGLPDCEKSFMTNQHNIIVPAKSINSGTCKDISNTQRIDNTLGHITPNRQQICKNYSKTFKTK